MHESEEHAALVDLFRNHPELAVRLVLRSGRITLADGWTATIADPVQRAPHLAADALVLVRDARGCTRLAILVEIQRGVDADKEFRWPLYGYAERDRQRCDCCVLVISLRPGVDAWARRLRLGGPDDPVQLILCGAAEVPRISELAAARAFPALAVLSAAIHGRASDGLPIIRAAAAALQRLPPRQRVRYSSLVFHDPNKTGIREILEDIMQEQQHQDQDDREYAAGWKAFCRELEEVGEARGEARGEMRGEARGEMRSRAEVLLRLLAQRGLAVDAEARARVLACREVAQLDAWIDRVLVVRSAAELFA